MLGSNRTHKLKACDGVILESMAYLCKL